MDTIFINTENGRTSEYHVLLFNLTNKIDLRNEKTVALSNLSIYYTFITHQIKNGYYLELLTPETIKLLGSSKSKITKDENGEDVPNLEVVEVVLVHCNLVNNDYQQESRILYTFVPNQTFGSL